MRLSSFARLLLLALSCAAAPALAKPPQDEAAVHYRRATTLFNLARYDQAVAEYEAAYQLRDDPIYLYEIAQAHRLAGHRELALTFYRNYLRLAPDAPEGAEVEQRIADLARQGPAPAAATPPATLGFGAQLVVTSDSPGTVFVDGAAAGKAPLTLSNVYAGRHRVHVQYDRGGHSNPIWVLAIAGQNTPVAVETPELARAYWYHEPLRGGLSVAAMIAPRLFGSHSPATYGARVTPFLNLGLRQRVELRFGPQLYFGTNGGQPSEDQCMLPSGQRVSCDSMPPATNFSFGFGAEGSLRFHLSSFYTMTLGISVGGMVIPRAFATGLTPVLNEMPPQGTDVVFCGLFEFSPLTIRLGPRREFEIGYTAGIGILDGDPLFENLITLSWVSPLVLHGAR